MFKFIQKYAETMENASMYPILSLLIFFIFFAVLIYFVVVMDKKSVQVLSNIPLDNNDEPNKQPQ